MPRIVPHLSRALLGLVALATPALQAQGFTLRLGGDSLHRFAAAELAVIDSIAQATLREVRVLLPGLPARITLDVVATREVIDVTGEGGLTPEPGRITWSVDPTRPGGVLPIVHASLRHTLYHELHHLARGWTVRGGRPLSGIMDAVVAEGLATVFARVHGGHRAPWGEAPPDVEAWVAELRALPPGALREYYQWMMQHPDGRRWIGYRAGAHLVERALQRSGRDVLALTALPTAEVVALAYPD